MTDTIEEVRKCSTETNVAQSALKHRHSNDKNREDILEVRKQYREQNRDNILEQKKQYRERYKEQIQQK